MDKTMTFYCKVFFFLIRSMKKLTWSHETLKLEHKRSHLYWEICFSSANNDSNVHNKIADTFEIVFLSS